MSKFTVITNTAYMSNKTNKAFQGFYYPEENYFRMPNIWTDITFRMSSLAELKVVEYVLRHTWGYREMGKLKKITLDEFGNGRRKTDGTRMDKGIGMRKQAIISGLRQAVKDGYLIEEIDKSDRGRIKKFYGLRMLETEPNNEGGEDEIKEMYENHTPDVRKSYPRSMKIILPSEKETIERNLKKNTVNGVVKGGEKDGIKKLKNLDQPKERADYVAQYILKELGDKKSEKFYRLVAAKIPEHIIYETLSEIKADGAKHPARLFTYKMKQYALKQNKKGLLKDMR